MIQSMTAFARLDEGTEFGDLAWEVRTVNHRYLDINLRLPDDLRRFEPAVRERVAARLKRGRVDLTLRFAPRADEETEIEIDTAMVDRVAEAARVVAERLPAAAPVSVREVLRWPGVIRRQTLDAERLGAGLLDLLDRALGELSTVRSREGERLAAAMAERLDAMVDLVARIRERLPAAAAAHRERLVARLAEAAAGAEPGRLEQELAFYLQRADVDEELERLGVHMDEVRRVLDAGSAVGRRLDFLMQELHREVNTLGSKSSDAAIAQAVVDLKVLVEQMREQVQNLE